MNRLDTSLTGLHPLTLADFKFIQDTWIDTFKGVVSAYKIDSLVLSGCIKTLQSAGVWAISAGYVVLDQEIYYVPSHTVSFTSESDPLYWKIEQTVVEPSPVEYKYSGAQDVHFQRVAKVSTVATDFTFELPNLTTVIERQSRRESGELTLMNSWQAGTYGGIRYKVVNGVCHLEGTIAITSSDPSEQLKPICEIPGHLLPYYDNSNTISDTPSSPNKATWALYNRGFVFPSVRIDVSIPNTYTMVATEVYSNFQAPVPRAGVLQVLTPGIWSSYPPTVHVVIKINTSWVIKPL